MTYDTASVMLANKLKLAIETCEPDILKLLSVMAECIGCVELLSGGSVKTHQILGFDTLLCKLNCVVRGETVFSNSYLNNGISNDKANDKTQIKGIIECYLLKRCHHSNR